MDTNRHTQVDLRAEIERFDPHLPIDAATPPPASWYIDPAFLELERETTFRRHWQVVGRLDQVEAPGDFFTGSIVKRPYVVTRDEAGTLRAFYNVCAHHGTCVAQGCGSVSHFTCPYHGWEYHLSGELKRAPRAGAVLGLEHKTVGLVPIPVSTFGPFVSLHLGEGDPAESAAELQSVELQPVELQSVELQPVLESLSWERLQFVTRRVFEVPCNWKVFVDNFLDGGYHVPHMHPALGASLQLEQYSSQLGGTYSVQSCPAGGPDAGRLGERAIYVWIHPNFMINRYGPWMDTNLVLPLDAQRCAVVFDYYFEGQPAPDVLAAALSASETVQREDEEISDLVQEGLESGAYRGLYAPRFEAPMLQFHQLLHRDFTSSR